MFVGQELMKNYESVQTVCSFEVFYFPWEQKGMMYSALEITVQVEVTYLLGLGI